MSVTVKIYPIVLAFLSWLHICRYFEIYHNVMYHHVCIFAFMSKAFFMSIFLLHKINNTKFIDTVYSQYNHPPFQHMHPFLYFFSQCFFLEHILLGYQGLYAPIILKNIICLLLQDLQIGM